MQKRIFWFHILSLTLIALVHGVVACNTTAPTSQRSQQGANNGASNTQPQVAATPSTPPAANPLPANAALPLPNLTPATAVVAPAVPVATSATDFNATLPVFHIKAGTGKGPWNDASTPMLMSRGGDFQLVNDDSEPHWLHTNGRPFPHPGQPLAPGASGTYRVMSDFSGALHDHLTNAAVYLQTQ